MRTWPTPQIPLLPGLGLPVRVRDTSTGELVEPATGDTATMYVCGITPYDATHIGHAATYVTFDLLGRAWRDAGHHVRYASNVTDVDDPLLERATATGVDWRDLAVEQTALFAEDMTELGVIPPDTYLGAVETVPQVAEAVRGMLADGTAYRVPLEPGAGGDEPELGDVYACLSADPAFGEVARLDRETMETLFAERGGDPAREGKKDRLDPLLWRRERPGEPTWDGGTLGSGRPGWHIECAVIAQDGLGLPFDVQGGGADLAFPHHEMSASHERLLDDGHGPRAHMHVALVSYAGEKMSKSRGNLVLVSKLRADGVDPMAIRLALLAHHYGTEWEWTDADLTAAQTRLAHWRAAMSGVGGPDAAPTLERIRAALANDLDAPAALAAVDEWADAALAGLGVAGTGGDEVGDAETTSTGSATDPKARAEGWQEGAPGVISRAINALLGVRI